MKFYFFIRIYCSIIGSTDEDVLLLEEPDESVYVNIRHTKDFHFVIVNTFSTTSSKVSHFETVCSHLNIFCVNYINFKFYNNSEHLLGFSD